MFNYDPTYRDRLMEGLRKAGVPEGAGTDIPFEKYRALVHKSSGYYDVTGATTVDLQQAKRLHDRGVKFVDVRAALDFARGHVPRAFNLDVATALSRDSLSRIVGKDEEFVLSCHGKTCPGHRQRQGPDMGFQAGLLLCGRLSRVARSRIPGRSVANEVGILNSAEASTARPRPCAPPPRASTA